MTRTEPEIALDVLAVGPHPDDAEIFAGALLLHCKDQGLRVGIVDLTRGELGSRGSREIRDREALEASQRLGLSFRENLDLPDGDLRDDEASRHSLARVLRRTRPRLLLGPTRSDYHPDHVAAADLVGAAYFLAGLERLELGFRAHRPAHFLRYLGNLDVEPRFVFDATPLWERKRSVVQAYESQISQGPRDGGTHLMQGRDVLSRMEIRARHFGLLVGCEFGEPYTSDRPPRMDQLPFALGP